MQRAEFNSMRHNANTFVEYDNSVYYVIAVNFSEALFALVPDNSNYPADEWTWVRCESVTLRKPAEVVEFHR